MPQMSPMNWLFLYIYVLMILLIINIILNYLIMSNNLNTIKKVNDNKLSYKWMW